MYYPQVIAADYETALLDGTPSVDFFRDDFRAISCAFAWRSENGEIKTYCAEGEDKILQFLTICVKSKLVAHNYQFEWGVTLNRFPGYEHLFCIDTMRLSQLCDNGGKEFVIESEKTIDMILSELEGSKYINGLSLEGCNSRLGSNLYYKHKDPYKTLMLSRGGTKASFELLTSEELAEYNILDAKVTLDLYESTIKILESRKIMWESDHDLYMTVCRQTTLSRCRGVHIDRLAVDRHIDLMVFNLAAIEREFREAFRIQIEEIEAQMLDKALKSRVTEKAKAAILQNPPMFNINSTNQLKMLFVDKLGIKPLFLTKKEKPSFSSKLLQQWGDGGIILKNRGKYMIEKAQGEALKALSEYDGKWHISIRVSSTRSGRLSGGN